MEHTRRERVLPLLLLAFMLFALSAWLKRETRAELAPTPAAPAPSTHTQPGAPVVPPMVITPWLHHV